MARLLELLDEPCDRRFLDETEATLGAMLGADAVHLVPFDTLRGAPPYLRMFAVERRYHGPLFAATQAQLQLGGYVDTELWSKRDRDRLPFYDEVLRPLGLRSQVVHLIRFRGQVVGVVHGNRIGARASGFGASAVARLRGPLRLLGAAVIARRGAPPPLAAPLSSRQAELAALVVRGLHNHEIAARLGTSPNTVRNQLHTLFRKLKVGSRVELASALLGRADAALDADVLRARSLLHQLRL